MELPDKNDSQHQSGDIVPADLEVKKSSSKRWLLILIPIILIAAVFIWKQIQLNNARDEAEAQQQELKAKAGEHVTQMHLAHLQLLAKPFVWALRTEMLQGNMSQVNLYLNEMVKEENFTAIAVANENGTIVASTDKKFEGQPFSEMAHDRFLNSDKTIVEKSQDGVLLMSSPIMGFNNRLGTLYLQYQTSPFTP